MFVIFFLKPKSQSQYFNQMPQCNKSSILYTVYCTLEIIQHKAPEGVMNKKLLLFVFNSKIRYSLTYAPYKLHKLQPHSQ